MTKKLLEVLKPEIRATIRDLRNTEFSRDPLAGARYSKVTSVFSSAYKRHGNILERTIFEILKSKPHLEVWTEDRFFVSETVDQQATLNIDDPLAIMRMNKRYEAGRGRKLQIDILVFNKNTKSIGAYEIKRGHGDHDAGKKRQMIRDALCTQLLLKSYAETRDLKPRKVNSHFIFYYGKRSIPAPFGLTGAEIDRHFGFKVRHKVEAVNAYFRTQLYSLIE
jgi:hypothetical protein